MVGADVQEVRAAYGAGGGAPGAVDLARRGGFALLRTRGTLLAAGAAPALLDFLDGVAPPDLRVRAHPERYLEMNLMARADIDAIAALRAIPPLIKAYLRLGGFVGEGAYVDEDFNTIDVCVVMDTVRMTERYLQFYQRGRERRG